MILGAAGLASSAAGNLFAGVGRARRPLDILVLGGTGFLGPHQVEYALARGHRVTLFNRGRRDASPYGNRVEILIGDRDSKTAPGLTALEGARQWDAVIDNSGYIPRHVRDAAQLLKGRVRRYLYVSTVAVYAGGESVCREDSKLRSLSNPESEQRSSQNYGEFKAEGDRIVREIYGDAATVVRPTYVVGPGDETDRFTYWVERVAAGGNVIGPRADALPLETVDVRDLCPWLVTLLERDVSGIFNASAPPLTWYQVLETLRPLSVQPVNYLRPSAEVIEKLKVNFPLVDAPSGSGIIDCHFDGSKATRAGLRYRALSDSARATLAWWRAQTPERRAAAKRWPTAEQEKAVLELMNAS